MLATANSFNATHATAVIPTNNSTSPKLARRKFKANVTAAAANTITPLTNGSDHSVQTIGDHSENGPKSSNRGAALA